MNNAELQMLALGDPRLAVHATSALPAGCGRATARGFCGPIRPAHACSARPTARRWREKFSDRPIRIGGRSRGSPAACLPSGAVRLERLQGFGATPGMLATCGCSRLDLPDGSHGILVAAGNRSGRAMPLPDRLQRLVEGLAMPVAAFTRDGILIGTSDAARPLLGFQNLVEAGLDDARRTR